MSKLASHWPFGHLQPKLWAKEGPGVKLLAILSFYFLLIVVKHWGFIGVATT
jgi:hypothetical protein